ncbi:MAG: hypothetical protein AABX11_02370 [Nanoarchaeota archaeon]
MDSPQIESDDLQNQLMNAKLSLLDTNYSILRTRYLESDSEKQRSFILSSLEKLARKPKPTIRHSPFDGKKARKIREDDGLNRRALIDKLECRVHEIDLYKYESGIVNPIKRPVAAKYLEYLRDKGYDVISKGSTVGGERGEKLTSPNVSQENR